MRLRSLAPYLFALLALGLLVWTGYKQVKWPTLDFYWEYSSGLIYQVDSSNPSFFPIKSGDRLLSVNGLEPKDAYKLIDHGQMGTVLLQIERAGSIYSIEAEPVEPNFYIVLSRISLILIAFSFWLAGTLIYAFGQDRKQALLFLLFYIFASITLTTGSIPSFGPGWSKLLFHVGLVWGGFFAIRLHLDFPTQTAIPYQKTFLICLALVSSIQTILFVFDSFGLVPMRNQQLLWSVSLLILTFEMLVVIGIIGKAYLRASLPDERYRAGIIVLAAILGVMPVLLFSMLPEILMRRTLLPYEFSSLSLLFFPLGYGYAMLRLKLVYFDSTMDHGAALTLVILILAGFYAITYSLLSRFLPGVFDRYPFAGMLITIMIAAMSHSLYGRSLFWINRVLYGERYDYRSAINLINDNLKSVETEFQAIMITFCQVVMKALQLDFAAMISQDRWFTLVETGNEPGLTRISDENFASVWSVLTASDPTLTFESYSNKMVLEPILSDRLMQRVQLVTPIQSREQVFGLLILSRKRGGGIFEKSDMDVLDVAIHQAQISLEKAQLLIDLREYSEDIRELHRKVTRTREEERKQVARELHDQIIQSLVSLNYQLSDMRRRPFRPKDEDIQAAQDKVVSVIGDLRQICTSLHPPVIDSLDLASAFRSKIDEYLRQSTFRIRLFVHGNREKNIPEPVRMFAYRLLQESLVNVSKHAEARLVEVHLSINSDELIVIVQDDGKGFSVPVRLSKLEKTQHFGLISLVEDADTLKGTLEIDSAIGEGCCLVATIPLE